MQTRGFSMTRDLRSLCALLLLASTAGCHYLSCGPGTKQSQNANGDSVCTPVDEAAADIVCDPAAGDVSIVNGKCASRIQCDPQTAMVLPSGLCVGLAGNGSGCPTCPTPAANGACVSGNLYDFATGMQVAPGGRPLRVAVYDPIAFLGNPEVAPIAETTTTAGCFALPFTPPGQIMVVAVSDPAAGPGALPPLSRGAVGAAIANGHVYKMDGFVVERALVDGWSANGGSDFSAKGAYVACYYDEPAPAATDLSFVETMPVAGVQLLFDGLVPSTARYLGPDRAIDPALPATGPLGCAVAPTDGGIHGTGGSGGGVTKWEQRIGGSAADVVFLDRFHSCDKSSGAATCM
jgi:hypothetical protein